MQIGNNPSYGGQTCTVSKISTYGEQNVIIQYNMLQYDAIQYNSPATSSV